MESEANSAMNEQKELRGICEYRPFLHSQAPIFSGEVDEVWTLTWSKKKIQACSRKRVLEQSILAMSAENPGQKAKRRENTRKAPVPARLGTHTTDRA